tara:strand:- start:2192 stop:2440 length:249 start_codon:yes stop_codon:yes gene_type:complete
MAELLIKGTKVAEKVNNIILQYGDMYLNKQTYTNDLTLDANYNATITGPITVNNITVNGNLIVLDDFHVTNDIAVTGSVKLI